MFCQRRLKKIIISPGMHGERKGLYGGQEVTLGMHLQLFKAGRLAGKQHSIIELCVKRSRDSGSVVAVLSPSSFLLCLLYVKADYVIHIHAPISSLILSAFYIDPFSVSKHFDVFLWVELR